MADHERDLQVSRALRLMFEQIWSEQGSGTDRRSTNRIRRRALDHRDTRSKTMAHGQHSV
jgi:hypothetical protein